MAVAYFGLGSNIGKREENMKHVLTLFESYGIHVVQESSFYESEPWGVEGQANFLNQVIKTETDLSPKALVCLAKEIEQQLGRIDSIRWGPRIIDVDLLLYEDQIVDEPTCTVPHYLMHKRNFVLVPFSEIAPEESHPVLNKTVQQMLSECDDTGKVEKIVNRP